MRNIYYYNPSVSHRHALAGQSAGAVIEHTTWRASADIGTGDGRCAKLTGQNL